MQRFLTEATGTTEFVDEFEIKLLRLETEEDRRRSAVGAEDKFELCGAIKGSKSIISSS